MAFDLDADKNRQPKAEASAVQARMITPNDTCLLQRTNPPQTGGWRQSNLFGKLDIGQTRIPLQRGEDSAVNRIKF